MVSKRKQELEERFFILNRLQRFGELVFDLRHDVLFDRRTVVCNDRTLTVGSTGFQQVLIIESKTAFMAGGS